MHVAQIPELFIEQLLLCFVVVVVATNDSHHHHSALALIQTQGLLAHCLRLTTDGARGNYIIANAPAVLHYLGDRICVVLAVLSFLLLTLGN